MMPYLMKIRGGVDVDSMGKKAGKGPLIAEDISNTIGTAQDQYLFQPIILDEAQTHGHPPVVVGVDCYNQCVTGDVSFTLRSAAQNQVADTIPCVVYSVENHPHDSRVKIDDAGKVQTLSQKMGTGGGNVPLVMIPYAKSRRAKDADDFETWNQSEVANTLNTFDVGDIRSTNIVAMATQQGGAEISEDGVCPTITAAAGMSGNNQPVICIQGNVIDRSDTAGANGSGWKENTCYTLNTIDRPAVVYATGNGQVDNMVLSDKFGALDCMHDQKIAVIAIDRAAFNQGENAKYDFSIDGGGTAQTVIARGPGAVCYKLPEHADG